MTNKTEVQTFHPELEAIFDEAQSGPVMIDHPEHPGIALSAELFDQMVAKADRDVAEISHQRITRAEGKGDAVLMKPNGYADLLDATQVVSEVTGDAIRLAFND
jgi:hypothetical protein